MKNLFAFFAMVLAFNINAQTKTLATTLPQSDTINVSKLPSNIEIIETVNQFASIEVDVKISNVPTSIGNGILKNPVVFGVSYDTHYQPNSSQIETTVSLNKTEFFITVGGNDVEVKRIYRLYVPQGQAVKR